MKYKSALMICLAWPIIMHANVSDACKTMLNTKQYAKCQAIYHHIKSQNDAYQKKNDAQKKMEQATAAASQHAQPKGTAPPASYYPMRAPHEATPPMPTTVAAPSQAEPHTPSQALPEQAPQPKSQEASPSPALGGFHIDYD